MVSRVSSEELIFVINYVKLDNAAGAYKLAYPEDEDVVAGRNSKISKKATALKKRGYVQQEIERHSKATEELALELIRDHILSGKAEGKIGLDAALLALKYKDRNSIINATERWGTAMCNLNARVLTPK